MTMYDDIRPYQDDEVPAVVKRLVNDKEFLQVVAQFRLPMLYKFLPAIAIAVVKVRVRAYLSNLSTVRDFQLSIEHYMESMLARSAGMFDVSGLAEANGSEDTSLDPSQSYIFISNHRDITLDPALTSLALHRAGGGTPRIAIGDNLLTKQYATDLMRLNKSFIVSRSISKPRELLKALKKLSAYIYKTVVDDKENIWIAHREGRAKDGLDKTDVAVIKMLTLNKPKELSFAEYVKQLRIVPLSISYEFDPCDQMKAKELRMISENHHYVKAEHEDLKSIAMGITGDKGNISIRFGEVLDGKYESPEELAHIIDDVIIENYQLHPSNILAYKHLYGDESMEKVMQMLAADERQAHLLELDAEHAKMFDTRIAEVPFEDRHMVLHMYANPVVSKLERC